MMNNRPAGRHAEEDAFCGRLLDLFQAIHPLDMVPRAGYLLRGVPHPESVSAHSHFLSLLALLVLEECGEGYDRAHVLSMALVHDLPEAQLMDIPMPSADAFLREAKAQAEQHIADALFVGFPEKFAALHAEFADARTPEARLVRGLDKAQMMIKVLNYEREQRGHLDEFWENPKNFNDYGIPVVATLFDTLCARAGRPRPR